MATIGEFRWISSKVFRLSRYSQMLTMMASFNSVLANVLFLSKFISTFDLRRELLAHTLPTALIAERAIVSRRLLLDSSLQDAGHQFFHDLSRVGIVGQVGQDFYLHLRSDWALQAINEKLTVMVAKEIRVSGAQVEYLAQERIRKSGIFLSAQ